MARYRIVPDTGFILQATLNPRGPAGRLLSLIEQRREVMLMSHQTRAEIGFVLTRSSIIEKYPRLEDGRVESMLSRLESYCEIVSVISKSVEFPRDPNDEALLSLAIQSHADFLVSRDNDLLSLSQSAEMRLLFPSLQIVNPVEVLTLLEAESHQG